MIASDDVGGTAQFEPQTPTDDSMQHQEISSAADDTVTAVTVTAVNVKDDDIVENSSPLRGDSRDDSLVFPRTAVDASPTCNIDGCSEPTTSSSVAPIPAALLCLPSLMQLSRQAVESRAVRLQRLMNTDAAQPPPSNDQVSHSTVIADMFSEDDNLNDSLAEMTQVV